MEWCRTVAGLASAGRPRPRKRLSWAVPGNCPCKGHLGVPRGRGETEKELSDSKNHLSTFCFPKTDIAFTKASPTSTEAFSRKAARSSSPPLCAGGAARQSASATPASPAAPQPTPSPRARLPQPDISDWLSALPVTRGGRVTCRPAPPLVVAAAVARAAPARRGSRWWRRRRNGRRLPVS